ncbi:MAG: hypothetical protein LC641_01410 [Spirochaeta sp.]|nr:hypothetical protein [Spirochaeta sp.]
MRVLIFYNSAKIENTFGSLSRSRNSDVELKLRDELSSCVSALERTSLAASNGNGGNGHDGAPVDLVYLDVSGMPAAQRTRSLRRLLAISGTAVGILDPQDELVDPAAWFREGAADYVGGRASELKIKARRFEEVLEWRATQLEDAARPSNDGAAPHQANGEQRADVRSGASANLEVHPDFPWARLPLLNLIPSPSQWSLVQKGTEYSFAMMYVGLDLQLGVSSDSRLGLLQSSVNDFCTALIDEIAPFHGKLWFWKDTSGLVLFPFDGESGDAIVAAMRIVLIRLFWQAEGRTNYVTKNFRLALDVGNTVYSDGSQRETLVSDMVNFMFHLGAKHAQEGQFVISTEMLSRCPDGLRPCFVPNGSFGGKKIWRMREFALPHSSGRR